MTDRPRLTIPFGGAVDRDSGLLVVDQNSFAELTNWHIRNGKLMLRAGLDAFGAAFAGDDEVVAIHPLRARSVGAAISYRASTGGLTLKIVGPDGTLLNSVALPQHVDADSPAPRFILTDSYKWVIIAHDEPDINLRLPTFAFNQSTGAFENLLSGGAAIGGLGGTVKFRTVARHLNYIVGTGWGTVGEPDRPEYLRISLPSEPLTFDPQHFFLVGQQGEPILKCDPISNILGLKKLTDTYQLKGYDRPSFGVIPLDPNFGQMAARLSVSVSGVNYFWSEAGPRRNGGGMSEDLALPLDLDGPAPGDMTPNDLDRGFAVYDHDHREVLFIFGTWAYVLHLDAPIPNHWSYHNFGIEITAAGVLYASVVSSAAVSNVIATLVAHLASTDRTQTWSITIAGDLVAGDRLEFWVKEPVGPNADVYAYHGGVVIPSTAFTQEVGIGAPLMVGEESDWAVRVTNSVGTPGTLYASSDPTLWPAVSRKTGDSSAKTTNPTPVLDSYAVVDASPDELRFFFTFDEAAHEHVTHDVEVSDGVGGWTAAAILSDGPTTARANVDAFAGLTRDVRIRQNTVENVSPDSAWLTLSGVEFVDPLTALITALGTFDGIWLADRGLVFFETIANLSWHGTKEGGADADTVIVSPTGAAVPTQNTAPARITFDGVVDKFNTFFASIAAGFTVLMVVKPNDVAGVDRCLFRRSDATGPRAHILGANGHLRFNGDATVETSTTRDGDWIVIGYTQAAGAAVGRGYDGPASLGDAAAPTTAADPMAFDPPGAGFSDEAFQGDLYALVLSPIHANDTQMSDAYDALVALALAAGITVTN